MMKNLVIAFLLFSSARTVAQTTYYTTANAHSHNDYQHEPPLIAAYNAKFGSIEADIMLSEDDILVAHTERDLPNKKRFEDVYIKPLVEFIKANNGNAYDDPERTLILMLDIKSESKPTITKVVELLSQYPDITQCKTLKVLVSGNRPEPRTFNSYPAYIWFDGLLSEKYKPEELSRIAVLSDNFKNYSAWKGTDNPPAKDWEAVQKAVAKGHELGKAVRLWNTPDFVEGWQKILELGVDYLDTFSIKSLAEFLKKNQIQKVSK